MSSSTVSTSLLSRFLHRLGRGTALHPWRTLGAWVVAFAIAIGLASWLGGPLHDDYTLPGTESQSATALLTDHFPEYAGADAHVVVHSRDGTIATPPLQAAAEEIATADHVTRVDPPVVSANGQTAMIGVSYDAPVTDLDAAAANDDLTAATEGLVDAGYQVEYGGQLPENAYEPEGRAEMIGIIAALVVLLLAFGSLLAAGLPLAVAISGLGLGTFLVTVLAGSWDVSTVATTLGTMVGLGVGIDYALFVVSRHRDGLVAGKPVHEAAADAIATAGKAVVFAGGTVLVALSGLAFTGVPNFTTMGVATGLIVLTSVAAAVTLLPALLGLMKLRVFSRKRRRQLLAGEEIPTVSHSPRAARLAARVSARPVMWTVASLTLLTALAAPALALELGQSDAGSESKDNTVRQAYDLVSEGFGAGSNAPLLIVSDLSAVSSDQVAQTAQSVADVPGIASVTPVVTSPDGDVALFTATPTTAPQDAATSDLVEALRSDVLPDGMQITGFHASMIDFSDVMASHLWVVVSVVVLSSLVLLLIQFRSVVIPLKAAFMNLLSVGAAYGVIALVFQTEAGAHLVGLPDTVPVAPYVPVLIFAVLFGLSMDYEVFLLSRIREIYLETGDAAGSVQRGLSETARTISSAAAIMVMVFLGFAMDPIVVVKMIGVGMAAAVLIDATVIRLVLVPATMTLLGKANWWAPRWMRAEQPRVSPAGTPAEPADATDANEASRERELEPVG
jgi:RND superfamily putative drug exporter